jgi:hypothetical protein
MLLKPRPLVSEQQQQQLQQFGVALAQPACIQFATMPQVNTWLRLRTIDCRTVALHPLLVACAYFWRSCCIRREVPYTLIKAGCLFSIVLCSAVVSVSGC